MFEGLDAAPLTPPPPHIPPRMQMNIPPEFFSQSGLVVCQHNTQYMHRVYVIKTNASIFSFESFFFLLKRVFNGFRYTTRTYLHLIFALVISLNTILRDQRPSVQVMKSSLFMDNSVVQNSTKVVSMLAQSVIMEYDSISSPTCVVGTYM